MALSLKDLQEVMQPLSDLGKGEETFEVNGLKITLRNLTPEEEIATQRYARAAILEGESNDQISALDYLDRFRAACLGYSIIEIGSLNFRGVGTVETGEKLPNGVAVKVKKHEAIIKVMEGWTRTMVTAIFQRFTALSDRLDSLVEKNIQYDEDHIDAEISRLEERITELKATKSKRVAGEKDPRKDTLDLASNRTPQPEVKPEAKPEAEVQPETWETARMNRTAKEEPYSVEVPDAAPKMLVQDDEEEAYEDKAPEVEAPKAVEPPKARKPIFGERPPVREPPKAAPDPLQHIESSLVDTSDPDVIEAENRRLMAERAKRVAPHLSAREVARALESDKSTPVEIKQTGSIGGVPVFSMPVQNLTPETAKPVRPPPPVTRSNINPKFRPAK